ncbi:hypothetical protein [Helicobacter sp. T3_23-1059]
MSAFFFLFVLLHCVDFAKMRFYQILDSILCVVIESRLIKC